MYLFVNDSALSASLTFTDQAVAAGLDHDEQGRGLLRVDYDNDGDQDLMVFTNRGALRLYRNDISGSAAVGLRVQLDSGCDATVPPHGVGAEVFVSIGGKVQRRYVDAGSNFLTQSELSAHFGLANAAVADAVRVRWPDGGTTSLAKLNAQSRPSVRISRTGGDVDGDGCVGSSDLTSVLAAWGSCSGCSQDLTCDGIVGEQDLEIVLTHWGC